MPSAKRTERRLYQAGVSPVGVYEFQDEALNKETERIEIVPLPCIHYGNPAHQALLLKWAIDYIKADPFRFGLFMGDMIENAITGSKGDVYNDTHSPIDQIDDIIRKFTPIAGKIIAVLRGNHEKRTIRAVGVDPGMMIAYGLRRPYLGIEGIIRLKFGRDSWTGNGLVYHIYAHHGWGGGRTMGSKINNLDRMTQRVEGCDVYMMAHTHQMAAYPSGIYAPSPRSDRIVMNMRLMVMCGSFLGGNPGPEYAAEAGYQPTVPGTVIVSLSGRRKEAMATVRAGSSLKVGTQL